MTSKITPVIGHQATVFAGNGVGATAYVSPDQDPERYRSTFDAGETIELLQCAITAVQNGDGTKAVKACGAAWFRLSSFHHS